MSYIQKQRGKYRARFTDPLGKVQSRTFARKTDGERFLRELEADLVKGQYVDPRDADTPLALWADDFLRLCRRLAPTTQETYARDLEHYILPRFGAYRLGRLPAEEIENWLHDEVETGLAPSSVHRHYRTLRRMLHVVVEKQKLLANPCDRVDPPRVPKRDIAFLDWDHAVRLAEAHNDRFKTMIYVAVDSGMRWSEIVGLRRSNVDLRRHKIRVTDQLVRLESGEFNRQQPKTPAGVRSITIASSTAEMLARHLEVYSLRGPDGLVFPNAAGKPLSASSFQTHHYKKAKQAVGVECRFHDYADVRVMPMCSCRSWSGGLSGLLLSA